MPFCRMIIQRCLFVLLSCLKVCGSLDLKTSNFSVKEKAMGNLFSAYMLNKLLFPIILYFLHHKPGTQVMYAYNQKQLFSSSII